MKNIKKINFAEISDKQALSIDQLSKIIGGSVNDACKSGVCNGGVKEANTQGCSGGAVCTSGASTCVKNSETDGKEEGGDKNDKPTCASSVYAICETRAV